MSDNLNEIIEEDESNVEATVDTTVEANGDLGEFVDISDTGDDEEVVETTDETTETPAETAAAVITFGDRAVNMGLSVLSGQSYYYSDAFSEIMYKNVKPVDETEVPNIPHLAIFTKGIEEDADWNYQNFISDSYKFLGNATLIDQIKESIGSIGDADLVEKTFMSSDLCKIRHEIIIQNANVVPDIGTVYPMMNITNTYNGSGASTITFGMHIAESDELMSSFCTEKFGKIKQIHLAGASTELSAAFGEYVTIFGNNIVDLITENFTNTLEYADMTKILDIIEAKAGKKRKELISGGLPVTAEGEERPADWSLTSWQLFLALTRFTSVEDNLNSKKILEDIAERVLIVPAQMIESLKVING